MGMEFRNLTPEQLCDLMCGGPEEPEENEEEENERLSKRREDSTGE